MNTGAIALLGAGFSGGVLFSISQVRASQLDLIPQVRTELNRNEGMAMIGLGVCLALMFWKGTK